MSTPSHPIPRSGHIPQPLPILNSNNATVIKPQSPDMSIPVQAQYKDNIYPMGQILPHPLESNTYRMGSEEKRALERVGSMLILYNDAT